MSYIGNTPGDKYLTLEKQTFTTSATDTYVLDREVSGVNDIELFLNNVRQEPTEAYTISGTTLTLASAITSSDSMYCIYQGRSVGTQAPATGSVTNAMLAGSISPSKVSNLYPYRNLIINGDMSIAQRGTVTGITTGSYGGADRFKLGMDTMGTWTMSQETDAPSGQGFATSLKIACTTANASPSATNELTLQYRFEGQMLQSIKKGTSNAESLTLSFWIKSNKTGTYIAELFDIDNSRHINKSYTIDNAGTWEKKTITYTGDTTGTLDNDNARSLQLNMWLGSGSASQSGTLQTSWGTNTYANRGVGQVNLADSTSNYINITGVQLEVGTSASDFEFLPYDVNFERCVRYYYEWGGLNAYETAFVGTWTSSTNAYMKLEYYKEMRSTPSFSKTGSWMILGPGGTLGTTANTGHVTRRAIQIEWAGGSGGTQGWAGLVRTNNDTSARLKVDAEL